MIILKIVSFLNCMTKQLTITSTESLCNSSPGAVSDLYLRVQTSSTQYCITPVQVTISKNCFRKLYWAVIFIHNEHIFFCPVFSFAYFAGMNDFDMRVSHRIMPCWVSLHQYHNLFPARGSDMKYLERWCASFSLE